jgi:hypothetical protein
VRPRWRVTVGALALALGLVAGVRAVAEKPPCTVVNEHEGVTVPIDRLNEDARCQLHWVISGHSTVGKIGPIQTPIAQEFFQYLLDHPWATALLVDGLGMGNYTVTRQSPTQFWANDGDGTQGLFTLLHENPTTRIYHIAGEHQGQLFPSVRAKAVLFVRTIPVIMSVTSPVTTPEPKDAKDGKDVRDGKDGVETQVVSYVRLDDPVLNGLVRILRPLIGDAVTRKITVGMNTTVQLGTVIGQDPQRVLQQVQTLQTIGAEEQQTLTRLLQPYAKAPRAVAPAAPAP